MAKNVDFSICEFINQNMWFFTFNDFCENRYAIKKLYNELDTNGKRFYMWYVYANVRMQEKTKNLIWDFLNEYDPYGAELMKHWRFINHK